MSRTTTEGGRWRGEERRRSWKEGEEGKEGGAEGEWVGEGAWGGAGVGVKAEAGQLSALLLLLLLMLLLLLLLLATVRGERVWMWVPLWVPEWMLVRVLNARSTLNLWWRSKRQQQGREREGKTEGYRKARRQRKTGKEREREIGRGKSKGRKGLWQVRKKKRERDSPFLQFHQLLWQGCGSS